MMTSLPMQGTARWIQIAGHTASVANARFPRSGRRIEETRSIALARLIADASAGAAVMSQTMIIGKTKPRRLELRAGERWKFRASHD